jgi:hypothetical protein
MQAGAGTGIAAGLAALLLAPASLGAGLPRAQLALIPLPKAALGALAANLSLASDSGPVSNADAADNANGAATAKTFAALGRLDGYSLDYGNAFVGGSGVREVQTTVEMYRDAVAAGRGLAFWRADETKLAALRRFGIDVTNTPLKVPAVGEESFAYRGRMSIASTSAVYGVDEYFRSGAFVVEVSIGAGTFAAAARAATALTGTAEKRLGLVLAGKVAGPPVRLPGPVQAGPPPHGPDLATLVLAPADLGQATITHQGYQVDKDLEPVSEFDVTMAPAGNFASLGEQVMLMHSPVEAAFTVAVLNAAFAQPGTFSDPSFKSVDVKAVPVSAGDEAYGSILAIALKNGSSVDEALLLVRSGALVALVTAAVHGAAVLPSAVTGLASLAATRLK